MRDRLVPLSEANLSVTSSAVLYGLSVYTVFPVEPTPQGLAAFRLHDHWDRLVNSSKIIGIDTFATTWTYEKFVAVAQEVIAANTPTERVFVRATVHVDASVAGTRSRGLSTAMSMFVYEASPIVPQDGCRLKTSVWRRTADDAIPSRAKVNGAYVNSVLAKQDALDSGYDDCLLLDDEGHVCELSAANIFIVRNGTLITPGTSSDILEGINRRTVLGLAAEMNIPAVERTVDLTELYLADEAFACGTSAFIAPVKEVDARMVGNGTPGAMTMRLRERLAAIQHGDDSLSATLLTLL
ncbi:branched-chain amino acid aminotransferase [Candidatus Kaiserbacteria bacterium]|nr:branched-chain amino acid aminotransferase [Candidatus Kaiserbacteria bacterium]